ncbi:hypothetical protein G7068_11795 [Leucobacter viscericola]|uniref:Uncharacterized protein n=1 Tax=Leucobacter viscericola TaxID=2714935 RepID=A0A6G7XHF2_9MICO|nr:hypothetical protein [Leucobacter viscericola]QIK63791.1 hypothetical protein G7068_11795 [Leucobacter viscericola]
MTVLTPLNLTTAEEIKTALEFVGIDWEPSAQPPTVPGLLYVWGIHAVSGNSLEDFAVLYIGKDVTAGKRLEDEHSWSGDEYVHGHALAVQRTQMSPLAGNPSLKLAQPAEDLRAQISHLVSIGMNGTANTREEVDRCLLALDLLHSLNLAIIETFAIRLSVHFGDVGAPINCSGKNAWAVKSKNGNPLDALAYWVSLHLKESALARPEEAPHQNTSWI